MPQSHEDPDQIVLSNGMSVTMMSHRAPVLLVFLRHFGCSFAREALVDLGAQRRAIEAVGARLALVHMGPEFLGRAMLSRAGLADVPSAIDPTGALYETFGLARGSWWQLVGPAVVVRILRAAFGRGILPGRPAGDIRQLPGVFLIHRGTVERALRHRSAAERPNYVALASLRTTADLRAATAPA